MRQVVWLSIVSAHVGIFGLAATGCAPTTVPTAVTSTGGQGEAPTLTSPSYAPDKVPVVTVDVKPAASASTVGSPTLHVLAPADGSTIALPGTFEYEITGGSTNADLHVHIYVGDPDTGQQWEAELDGARGTSTIPDDPRLTGRRDLTFQLATADHTLLENGAAKKTIHALVMEGSRSAVP